MNKEELKQMVMDWFRSNTKSIKENEFLFDLYNDGKLGEHTGIHQVPWDKETKRLVEELLKGEYKHDGDAQLYLLRFKLYVDSISSMFDKMSREYLEFTCDYLDRMMCEGKYRRKMIGFN